MPAIALDLDGTMFGITGGDKTLITIDTNTGLGTAVGAFVADVSHKMGGLAIDPATGILYGAGGGSADNFLSIDKVTGAATVLGSLTEAGTGNPLPNNLAGLAFDPSGNLFGSLGALDGRIISIDVTNLEFTILGNAFNGSVTDIAFVPEPASCFMVVVGAGVVFVWGRRTKLPRGWPRNGKFLAVQGTIGDVAIPFSSPVALGLNVLLALPITQTCDGYAWVMTALGSGIRGSVWDDIVLSEPFQNATLRTP